MLEKYAQSKEKLLKKLEKIEPLIEKYAENNLEELLVEFLNKVEGIANKIIFVVNKIDLVTSAKKDQNNQ
ncbi:hypothetical protein LJ207_10205 [Halanaerobium sp. Z-7514]|uniref:GTP-binding protein HflX n=1 Tax=Halanaerobium polyolivorans TaxID=2886943 RepID=A0AAW4X1K5_9FIRM|nr:hypothetical protein [Halanaerobium polyolivorans]MCC3145695.1 hypothetical protein [Halanaerobium polyolivorans]